MNTMKLAFLNFRKSFRNYLSMILSLSFTVLILYNFLNLTYSEAFRALGERNQEYIDIIIRVVCFVLACFMFFFVWYATNVFLTTRKKEIGIYVFMGLTNRKIAKLYMLETIMIGWGALVFGICSGVILTQLFQMILLKISDIVIDISFVFSWEPAAFTAIIYMVIYGIFVLKGYRGIVKSSVLEMISASRQNEYVKTNGFLLIVKTVLGISILANGYYLAIKGKGMDVMGNLFLATALVIVGTYLLFGGFLPMLFQRMAGRKQFLYQKERNLWVNNMIFRMRKNYRTYAMVCVLLTCSVSALAAAFAQKVQHDNMVNFRNTYSYQIISSEPALKGELDALIEENSDIAYCAEIPFFALDGSCFSHGYQYGILSFSDVSKAAKDVGLAFPYESLADDEVICATHIYLMSFIAREPNKTVTIGGKAYREIDSVSVPYLGYLQESQSYYIVNDDVYEELLSLCHQTSMSGGKFDVIYSYNYGIRDYSHYEETANTLKSVVHNTDESYTGLVAHDMEGNDIKWIKVEYSLCVFMFLVFVLASGSILFMKIYNDAFEEKERYAILHKIGISRRTLARAAAKELGAAYAMPVCLMALSSWFAVHALEKIMKLYLQGIYLASVLIILAVLALFYGLSLLFYKKNAGIKES